MASTLPIPTINMEVGMDEDMGISSDRDMDRNEEDFDIDLDSVGPASVQGDIDLMADDIEDGQDQDQEMRGQTPLPQEQYRQGEDIIQVETDQVPDSSEMIDYSDEEDIDAPMPEIAEETEDIDAPVPDDEAELQVDAPVVEYALDLTVDQPNAELEQPTADDDPVFAMTLGVEDAQETTLEPNEIEIYVAGEQQEEPASLESHTEYGSEEQPDYVAAMDPATVATVESARVDPALAQDSTDSAPTQSDDAVAQLPQSEENKEEGDAHSPSNSTAEVQTDETLHINFDGNVAAAPEETEQIEQKQTEQTEQMEQQVAASAAQDLPEEHNDDLEVHTSSSEDDFPYLHPVKVQYQGNEISLFAPMGEDESDFFLQDETLANRGVDQLFVELRDILGSSVNEQEHLFIHVTALNMDLNEGLVQTSQVSLADVVDLYLHLAHNDGTDEPEPLYLILDTRPTFLSKFHALQKAAIEGQGISNLSLFEGEDHQADEETEALDASMAQADEENITGGLTDVDAVPSEPSTHAPAVETIKDIKAHNESSPESNQISAVATDLTTGGDDGQDTGGAAAEEGKPAESQDPDDFTDWAREPVTGDEQYQGNLTQSAGDDNHHSQAYPENDNATAELETEPTTQPTTQPHDDLNTETIDHYLETEESRAQDNGSTGALLQPQEDPGDEPFGNDSIDTVEATGLDTTAQSLDGHQLPDNLTDTHEHRAEPQIEDQVYDQPVDVTEGDEVQGDEFDQARASHAPDTTDVLYNHYESNDVVEGKSEAANGEDQTNHNPQQITGDEPTNDATAEYGHADDVSAANYAEHQTSVNQNDQVLGAEGEIGDLDEALGEDDPYIVVDEGEHHDEEQSHGASKEDVLYDNEEQVTAQHDNDQNGHEVEYDELETSLSLGEDWEIFGQVDTKLTDVDASSKRPRDEDEFEFADSASQDLKRRRS